LTGYRTPDPLPREEDQKVVRVLGRLAVQGGDDVPDHEAAAVRRAPVLDAHHQEAALLGEAQPPAVRQAHRLAQMPR
jgi:hypothetical protein